jgi:hypothetical protein
MICNLQDVDRWVNKINKYIIPFLLQFGQQKGHFEQSDATQSRRASAMAALDKINPEDPRIARSTAEINGKTYGIPLQTA